MLPMTFVSRIKQSGGRALALVNVCAHSSGRSVHTRNSAFMMSCRAILGGAIHFLKLTMFSLRIQLFKSVNKPECMKYI